MYMNGRSEFPSAGETSRHLEDIVDAANAVEGRPDVLIPDEPADPNWLPTNGAVSRTSPDGSVTVTVPCDEAGGELP
jgi:hypothetical protein